MCLEDISTKLFVLRPTNLLAKRCGTNMENQHHENMLQNVIELIILQNILNTREIT